MNAGARRSARAAARTFVALVMASLAATLAVAFPRSAVAALDPGERRTLVAYLSAVRDGRFGRAFALLDAGERRYFASPANFASVFAADGFVLDRFRIVGSRTSPAGTVVLVAEHVRFRDHAHDAGASLDARVPYGIVRAGKGLAVHDPGHPWRAVAPAGASAAVNGLRVTVRKASFFTGRVELVVAFANRGASAVTLLPFGRSTLRDGRGAILHPFATRSAAFTDANLYAGLRLPSSGEYTGFLTFATPPRFAPATLALTIAPALADGGDAPFAIAIPAFAAAPTGTNVRN